MSFRHYWDKWRNWELWPMELRYFLITPVWFWYCFKARSFWFFTASNPTLTFGGFEGESKQEMYEQLPPHMYPPTIYIQPKTAFTEVWQLITKNQFSFPFVVKPDVGMAGILFRVIESEAQLRKYHEHIPVTYLVQKMVSYPVEFSVFYYRFPDQMKGVITGFLRKDLLKVTGNGKHSLWELILEHPLAKHRQEEMHKRHEANLNTIIPAGEIYFLSYAANLNRGGVFINLKHEIDAKLHSVFDELNLYSKAFFYGRYDLKATSLEDLKEGKNFSILEYNGSGAEPNHIYQSGYTLFTAYKEIIKHWDVLYRISCYNHRKGIAYWPLWKGWHFLQRSKKHFKLLKKCDSI